MLKKSILILTCIFTLIVGNLVIQADTNNDTQTGNNVTEDFQIDSMNITIAGKTVYDESGKTGPSEIDYTGTSQTLSINLAWSVIDQNKDTFHQGDYIEFDLLIAVGNDTTTFTNLSHERTLTFDNSVIGKATLIVTPIDDTHTKLSYRIVFTEGIENKVDISGTLYGSANFSGNKVGEHSEFYYNDELIAKVNVTQPSTAETSISVIKPSQVVKMGKTLNSYSQNQNTITWKITINNYLSNQFTDFEDNYENSKYDDLIIEEILDSNLSFTTSANAKIINLETPIYLYSDDFNGTTAIRYPYSKQTRLYDLLTNLSSSEKSNDTVLEAVKNTPRSYAIVLEADPENPSRTRERLVMNLGAIGSTGLRYTDVNYSYYKEIVDQMIQSYDYVNEIIETAHQEGKQNSDIIVGKYNDSYTLETWENMSEVYRKSIDYYAQTDGEGKYIGPYLYDLQLTVTTGIKYQDLETINEPYVTNRVNIETGCEKFTYEKKQDNFWNDSIKLTATKGDVVVYKSDSLYENTYTEGVESYEGLISNTVFEVYRTSDNVQMNFNKDGNKYVYSNSGSFKQVETGGNGTLILSGLPTGNYYLLEVTQSDGYYRVEGSKAITPFTTSSKIINHIMVENTPRTVSLIKVDADDETVTLPNAEFELFMCTGEPCDANSVQITNFKKVVIRDEEIYQVDPEGTDPLITNEKGMLTISKLEAQTYYLKEKRAPFGYLTSNNLRYFTLGETSDDDEILFLGTFENSQSKMTIAGHKVWVDNNNSEGLRPDSIQLILRANGEIVEGVEPIWFNTDTNTWAYMYSDLPFVEGGKAINYTVEEVPVEGYTTTQDGFYFTNTHEPSYITIEGTKTWVDNHNSEGFRPDSIELVLKANGDETDYQPTWTSKEGDVWTYEYTNLPQYANGQEIKYTVTEKWVSGYDFTQEDFNLINTRIPTYLSISGTKTWIDNHNSEGARPDSIEIILKANGEETDYQPTWTSKDGDVWTYEYTNLPFYAKGQAIDYTVEEVAVDGYTTTKDGYDFTNTREPSYMTIEGTKTWVDDHNVEGFRPDSIKLILIANGVETNYQPTWTSKDGDVWTYEYTNLPFYAKGQAIDYTVEEVGVEGYESIQDGYNFRNVRRQSFTSITGTKTWVDNSDKQGLRPDSITLKLFANDVEVMDINPVWIINGDVWTFIYSGLPQYMNGSEIVYTIEEISVEFYELIQDGYDLINVLVETNQPEEQLPQDPEEKPQKPSLPNTGKPLPQDPNDTDSIQGGVKPDDTNNQENRLPNTGIETHSFNLLIISMGLLCIVLERRLSKKD
ncbi:hypothetical protein AOC36_07965 [Erysipelothrix larvae]|uniref:Gram-positive cocci surface proteins LPxTG domain-containing protein n=1 Tax=Erysipelothrix larvae TaxID=1514105 RepID=A0A0X8H0Q6_9FIRM|nr:Cna B-type domain-containing protein [Erysipelothrix larvae]AMC93922.1 hypothetical protein AOC36_07965 [Erysipelothrix larvae]